MRTLILLLAACGGAPLEEITTRASSDLATPDAATGDVAAAAAVDLAAADLAAVDLASTDLAAADLVSRPVADLAVSCDVCTHAAVFNGGVCTPEESACQNDSDCIVLEICINNCKGALACEQSCINNHTQVAAAEYQAILDCVCTSGGCQPVCAECAM